MKKLVNLILGIAVLATFAGLATAKVGAKIKSTTSNASLREAADKATPTPSPTPKKPVAKIKSTTSNTSDRATTVKGGKSNSDEKMKFTIVKDKSNKASPTPTPKPKEKRLKQLDAR